jgi:hypothetical protein
MNILRAIRIPKVHSLRYDESNAPVSGRLTAPITRRGGTGDFCQVEGRMDGQRFDELTRTLGLSLNRKRFVAALGALLVPAAIEPAAARKRGKKRRSGGSDVGAQGDPGFCEGFCEANEDCAAGGGCFCDEETNRCVILTCGGSCTKTADCPPLSGCECSLPEQRGDVGTEGALLGQCVTLACSGSCDKGLCPDTPGCVCDQGTNQCVTVLCGGTCETTDDCGGPDACLCLTDGENPGICTLVCKSTCTKDADCPPISGCVCDTELGACIAPPTCSGVCNTNEQCTTQGAEDCVCFLGIDTADPVRMAALVSEGSNGECGVCHGAGDPCSASTECCGQLVCAGAGPIEVSGLNGGGTCRRKPKPKDRCRKHGGSCRRDSDCCAQGSCYKGKCGEKDTHCHNDGECAQGYRCQGGPLAPGHRRCRKNGRRNRHRRNKNGAKR